MLDFYKKKKKEIDQTRYTPQPDDDQSGIVFQVSYLGDTGSMYDQQSLH